MGMDDLAGMGISFDEESGVIRVQSKDEVILEVQLPEGMAPEEAMEMLIREHMTNSTPEELLGQVRESLDLVDDALIDMIENNDHESNQIALSSLASANKHLAALMMLCEDENEEELVESTVLGPLHSLNTALLDALHKNQLQDRDRLIEIAACWLPVRHAVEEILEQVA